VLATKLFFPMSPVDRGLSAQQVRRQLDASLQRLRVDHVDLYLCHRYDRHTPLEDTMRALGDAVRAGKVRWLGLSEWSPVEIRAADDIARQEGLPPFVCSQPQYSPLWRDIEAEVIPTCETRGIGQVVCSPLAQGVLTGKYRAGAPPPADSRAASPESGMFLAQEGPLRNDEVLLAVEGLRPVAADLGVTMAQLALAWVLRQPNVASALTGATRPEQVEENVAASGVLLDAEALRRIDEAVGRVAHRAGDERRMRPR
jgi:aryl-alcohol dehydrogenase-like predicted oxidoreductase